MRRLAVLALLALAGCSGGTDVRAADYRAQATALCEQAAGLRGDVVAAERRRRRLLDLVPPPELAARHAELVEIAGIVERVGLSASRGSVSPARALERIARVSARARRTYRQMGIPACSSR